MSDFVIKTKNGKVVLTARQTHFFAAAIHRDVRAYVDSRKREFAEWEKRGEKNEKM